MVFKTCVIAPGETSSLLAPVQGTALLRWLVFFLENSGCKQFFLNCPDALQEEMLACFPSDTSVSTDISLLQNQEGAVLTITGAALPLEYTEGSVEPLVFSTEAKNWTFTAPGTPLTARDGWVSLRSMEDLARIQPLCKELVLRRLEENGVEIWDRQSCWVDPSVQVAAGTVLLPGTILKKGTVIGGNCRIGPNTLVENCRIGCGTNVNASQCYDSDIGDGTTVGPFAYVRPGTVVGNSCRVGDFVELKNANIGDGTKISHLTYVGDSDVGRNVNFGCGTVTVNYDRAKKHRTVIGDNCFIGCNTNLIAPVTLGSGVYTAAGSTVTQDVPDDALVIARCRQEIKEGWAKEHKQKVHK